MKAGPPCPGHTRLSAGTGHALPKGRTTAATATTTPRVRVRRTLTAPEPRRAVCPRESRQTMLTGGFHRPHPWQSQGPPHEHHSQAFGVAQRGASDTRTPWAGRGLCLGAVPGGGEGGPGVKWGRSQCRWPGAGPLSEPPPRGPPTSGAQGKTELQVMELPGQCTPALPSGAAWPPRTGVAPTRVPEFPPEQGPGGRPIPTVSSSE